MLAEGSLAANEDNLRKWPDRPHVILWLVDDLGWGNVGYNNRHFHTPHMNWMAANGVRLDRHYSYPWCTPSRAALMTGRMPWDGHQQAGQRVPEDAIMLAMAMKKAGYSTHHVGKWHLGIRRKWANPMHRGFDTSFGYLGGAEDYNTQETYSSEDWLCRGVDLQKNGKPAYGRNGTFSGDWFATEIDEVLFSRQDQAPLFLYVALQAVHKPSPGRVALRPWMKQYENTDSYKYGEVFKESAALVTHADHLLGGLNQSLHAAGMWSTTLIVHLSDNGGQVTFSNDVQGNNWPLRGFKRTLFEGGVRTPAFVSGGALPTATRGQVLDGFIHLADWYATLSEVVGLRWGPHSSTYSMARYLSGESIESPRTEIILGAGNTGGTVNFIEAAIRGSWKLINGTIPCGWDTWQGPVFPNASSVRMPWGGVRLTSKLGPDRNCPPRPTTYLFNIKNDPNESNNVVDLYPEKVAELVKLIQKGRMNGHPFESDHDRTNTRARLQAYCENFRDRHHGFLGQYMDMSEKFMREAEYSQEVDERVETKQRTPSVHIPPAIPAPKTCRRPPCDSDNFTLAFDSSCVSISKEISDEWCGIGCARKAGAFCPPTKCECQSMVGNPIPGAGNASPPTHSSADTRTPSEAASEDLPNCRSRTKEITDVWCVTNCARMVCPPLTCECTPDPNMSATMGVSAATMTTSSSASTSGSEQAGTRAHSSQPALVPARVQQVDPAGAPPVQVPTVAQPAPFEPVPMLPGAAATSPEQTCLSIAPGTSDGWCAISCGRGYCPQQCKCTAPSSANAQMRTRRRRRSPESPRISRRASALLLR